MSEHTLTFEMLGGKSNETQTLTFQIRMDDTHVELVRRHIVGDLSMGESKYGARAEDVLTRGDFYTKELSRHFKASIVVTSITTT